MIHRKMHNGFVVIGAFAAILMGCGDNSGASNSSSNSGNNGSTCSNVADRIIQGAKDYAANDYNGGYNNANSAVHRIIGCQDQHMKIGLSGAAISVRAWNEHHLTKGDSMADMRLAYGLLKTCLEDAEMPSAIRDLCTGTAGMNAQVTAGW